MIDMRLYKDTIRHAVKRESDRDENWNWNVKAVNKGKAKISWGYLDWLGETDCFEIQIEDDEELQVVVGTMPNGCKKYAFIGPNHWDDATTFGAGIALVVHSMAHSAHQTY